MSQRFTITFRAIPGWRAPEIVRLRHFLKAAKRAWGFQCVMIREDSEARTAKGESGESVSPGVNTADPIVKTRPEASWRVAQRQKPPISGNNAG
jgi:hypothetical protein